MRGFKNDSRLLADSVAILRKEYKQNSLERKKWSHLEQLGAIKPNACALSHDLRRVHEILQCGLHRIAGWKKIQSESS
jgi:hypothetical protein